MKNPLSCFPQRDTQRYFKLYIASKQVEGLHKASGLDLR